MCTWSYSFDFFTFLFYFCTLVLINMLIIDPDKDIIYIEFIFGYLRDLETYFGNKKSYHRRKIVLDFGVPSS